MEKFAEKIIVKLPLWKIFVGAFILFFTFIYCMFLMMDEVSGKDSHTIWAGLIFGGIISGGVTAMINLSRAGLKFYSEASKIEESIRNGEPQNEVIAKLRALDKKSFHRTTGERVRELIKMTEIKYDIELLKR